jgi:hypothetical protein
MRVVMDSHRRGLIAPWASADAEIYQLGNLTFARPLRKQFRRELILASVDDLVDQVIGFLTT